MAKIGHKSAIAFAGLFSVAAATTGAGAARAKATDTTPVPVGAVVTGDPLPAQRPPLPYGGPDGAPPTMTSSQILTFRKDFGLPTAAASLAAAAKVNVNNRYGLPLTEAELEDVKFQFTVDGNGPKADNELRAAYPDTFAEQTLDHAAGGVVTLSFLGEPPPVSQLSPFFPAGTRIVTRSVPFSKAELMEAQDKFEQSMRPKGGQVVVDGGSVPLEMTNVNTRSSTLDVYISPKYAAAADDLYRAIAVDFPMVRIVVFEATPNGVAISATNSNDPAIGGEYIQAHPIGSGGCTDASSMHAASGGDGFMTASHCDYGRQPQHTLWYLANSNTTVGFDVRYANSDGSTLGGAKNNAEAEILGWVNAQPKVWDWYSTDGAAYVVGEWTFGVAGGYTLYQSDGHENEVFMQPNGVYRDSFILYEDVGNNHTLQVQNAQDAYLCGVGGSSGSPVWTLFDRSPGGYDEVVAVGVTAASQDKPVPTSCGPDELVAWSVIGNDLPALGATIKTGLPPS